MLLIAACGDGFLEIHAGAEKTGSAGDHHGAATRHPFREIKGGANFADQRRVNAVPVARPGDSDNQLSGSLLDSDRFELQLSLARKCGKDLRTTLIRELTLRLILSRQRLPRFQVPRFEIQPVTFPS